MSDSYNAIYDAVCSRISNGDIGDAVQQAARSAMEGRPDQVAYEMTLAIQNVEAALTRPSVIYRPTLSQDGDAYCALYGADLQEGCAGFGPTAAEAMAAFDREWVTRRAS